jgi:ElaB/YqjD/DUF883 family membrane-anchored ribosome-binding protein
MFKHSSKRRPFMPVSMQIQRQFDALHRDAQRVLSTIDNLSNDIDRANNQGTKPATETKTGKEVINFDTLRSSLGHLRQKVEDTSKTIARGAEQLDSQVHSKPYPFIAGAMGVGALAALVLERSLVHRK